MYEEYYKILEISPNASAEDIKKAYIEASQMYHPDANIGKRPEIIKKFEAKFKEIREAYEVLSKLVKYKEQEQQGRQGEERPAQTQQKRGQQARQSQTQERQRQEEQERQRQREQEERQKQQEELKIKYDDLVAQKKRAKGEVRFRSLAQQFRDMGNYRDSLALAIECENIANRIKAERERKEKEELKIKYDNLVAQKMTATSEDDFRSLAQQFRDMVDYINAPLLAIECENIANKIKVERERKKSKSENTPFITITLVLITLIALPVWRIIVNHSQNKSFDGWSYFLALLIVAHLGHMGWTLFAEEITRFIRILYILIILVYCSMFVLLVTGVINIAFFEF
ncbi:MAG: J domain-containing protein [Oscillospiraceae bacterium]|nr:J domain-containing protein [Oscillospiraceae bacterium]